MLRSDVLELSQLLVPYLVFDTGTGEVIWCTPALEDVFSCRVVGGLVGKNITDLVTGNGLTGDLSDKRVTVSSSEVTTLDGLHLPVVMGFAAAVRDGRKIGVLTVLVHRNS